jgi:hypothetical protein
MLSEHRLLVFDLNAVRIPRSSYLAARKLRPWPEPDIMRDSPLLDVGQLRTCDFIFCRDDSLGPVDHALPKDVCRTQSLPAR